MRKEAARPIIELKRNESVDRFDTPLHNGDFAFGEPKFLPHLEKTVFSVQHPDCFGQRLGHAIRCEKWPRSLSLRVRRWDKMAFAVSSDVTKLLSDWSAGNQAALDELAPLVYRDLHQRARNYLRHERPDHTLQPTALIHEAYLRLVHESPPEWS